MPDGAFEGILQVTVQSIEGFSDTAGFMDRTDPYVSLVLGKEKRKTKYQNNAGGTAVFDETLTWMSKGLMESTLEVQVFDKDTLIDDFLGASSINIDLLKLEEGAESEAPVVVETTAKDGKQAGKVWLMFSRKAVPGGGCSGGKGEGEGDGVVGCGLWAI